MRFVLIAGALQPAWVWHKVAPLLAAAGSRVSTPDLPGLGENRSIPACDATLGLWGDFVADVVRASPEPVVLVGHSRGGLVIGEAAERVPERVAGLIYVTALIVPPGATALETMGAETSGDGPPLTEDGRTFWLPPEIATGLFYNRCSADDAREAAARLSPEASAPIATPSTVTDGRWGRLPRAYVETADDRTLSLERQRIIQSAAPCYPVLILDADHSPYFSAPAELADALIRIGNGFRRPDHCVSPSHLPEVLDLPPANRKAETPKAVR